MNFHRKPPCKIQVISIVIGKKVTKNFNCSFYSILENLTVFILIKKLILTMCFFIAKKILIL